MKLAIFGATGATGRALVDQAIRGGHEVTAFVRDRSAFAEPLDKLHVIPGDVLDAVSVENVLRGQDAVLSALGTNQRGPVSVCTDGVSNIVGAMNRLDLRRLVVVSAFGASETRDGSLYSRMLWRTLPHKMRDKDSMEAVLRGSDLEWTIVRPPALTSGPLSGAYRTGTDLRIKITSRISRADLAHFMLSETADPRRVRQAVTIVR